MVDIKTTITAMNQVGYRPSRVAVRTRLEVTTGIRVGQLSYI